MTTEPLYAVHRRIQQQGIEETVPTCLQKTNNLSLLPKEDADLIAPDMFTVLVHSTQGDFLINVPREWSPLGADRFYTLIYKGFFQEIPFFRVIRDFMAQFGIHSAPIVNQSWRAKPIQDDPANQSNLRGTISFATAGPNTRTTQLFISTANNASLDKMGFTPIGSIVHTPDNLGMNVVDSLFSGYGEGHPSGRGPSQELLQNLGTEFLKEHYPYIDYVQSMEICSKPNILLIKDCISK